MTREGLDACPLCGGENVYIMHYQDYVKDFVTDYCEDAYYDYESCFLEESDSGYIVVCRSRFEYNGQNRMCALASGWCATRKEAIERWNDFRGNEKTAVVFKRKKREFTSNV